MNSFESQTDSFKNYVQNERRLSVHTLTSYATDLAQFQEFLAQTFRLINFTEATHNEIRMWVVQLKENGISSRSINRKISTLKSFYKYLLIRNEVETNPMLKIISPKQSKKLPVYFEQKKLTDLFQLDVFTDDFQGLRDILILELLYGTGIRLSELINIKESDIHGNEIKVLGKGNKERLVPITSRIEQLIPIYKAKRKEMFPSGKESLLLLTNKGDKLYEKLVYRTVNHYLGLVTNEKKRSPHTMRHSFATNMLNNGAQLHTIKEILGHANLAATQIYTHNSIERLKDAYKKFHPKEN
ncbi:tyrosine-type recombinase/integrase [Flavobacteriales bacterium]|jgi:integrase/recombinase XerC|nr:tyrosine-type recombinase/integrase [Flavobacteriales bacterium]